jgi:hypothetical protein
MVVFSCKLTREGFSINAAELEGLEIPVAFNSVFATVRLEGLGLGSFSREPMLAFEQLS